MSLVIYIHGKGGSAAEAEHYQTLFPDDTVLGFDYKSETPWEAQKEFSDYFDAVSVGFDKVCLIANSIGAFFSLFSLSEKKIKKAFFVSPIVNMEKLICDMMTLANVTESKLKEKKVIPTTFGETLSWEYLRWVRDNPFKWKIPTEILYGEKDYLQTIDTINYFSSKSGAKVTVMKNGEHWFHTEEQMAFLNEWIRSTL
ncbi:MAG TPA: alpha/beta hydrolase [Ruminococcaceae bacterium]|nr:alpha/beta hydrolase [Oscillospiraceae bacterium]